MTEISDEQFREFQLVGLRVYTDLLRSAEAAIHNVDRSLPNWESHLASRREWVDQLRARLAYIRNATAA